MRDSVFCYNIFSDDYVSKYKNDYVSKYKNDDVMYNRMTETSNRLYRMNGDIYYDVAYKENNIYNFKNNYTQYNELIMDNNTMYNIIDRNNNIIDRNNSNNKWQKIIGFVKNVICCI